MITVAEAEQIILSQKREYGTEYVPFEQAVGRVLAEDIYADRDLPPYDRITMDGIAFSYNAYDKGIRTFRIKATQAAGDTPVDITDETDCIEIMTGAALPPSVDTIVRYEDLEVKDGTATILTDKVKQGQNIHRKGKDRKQGDVVLPANEVLTPAHIALAATVGKTNIAVKKLPRVAIISTGDELVAIHQQPTPYQVRRSNSYTIKAALEQYCIQADLRHLPEDADITKTELAVFLKEYDVIILSGGVSMGKFDHLPHVLEELGVNKLFHKVQQRPGKPFWFGTHAGGALVFAFPGNPVSTFLCLYRYFIPWLTGKQNITYAVLDEDVIFTPPLQYYMQVRVYIDEHGKLLASPDEGNGSGDFANLVNTNAFMELPKEESNFKKGAIYRVWPFKQII